MKNKFIMTGKESSILCFIAQTINISDEKFNNIIKELRPKTKQIARAIIGKYKGKNKDVISSANHFIEWRNSL